MSQLRESLWFRFVEDLLPTLRVVHLETESRRVYIPNDWIHPDTGELAFII